MAVRWVISPVLEQVTLVGQPVRDLLTGQVVIDNDTGQPKLAKKNYRERVPAVFRHLRAAKDANPAIAKCRCQSYAIGRNRPSHVATWCLCRIDCSDMAGIDADPEVEDLFEEDEPDWHAMERQTGRQRGWSQGRMNRALNRLASRGVNTTALTLDSRLQDVVDKVKSFVEAAS